MSARQDMAALLEQWGQFSHAEAAAIEAADWFRVRDIQARKAALQKSLTEVELRWVRENGAGQKPFRAQVGRLISLETRNAALLAAQLRRAQAEQDALNDAARNLQRIQRSYVRPSLPTAWQSYS